MKGIVFKGDIKDVCAEIENAAQRCKGMTVTEYLRLRKLEEAIAKQFGVPVEVYRRWLK